MEIVRNFDLLVQLKEKFNREDTLASKINGSWAKVSTTKFIEDINNISYGFVGFGVEQGR